MLPIGIQNNDSVATGVLQARAQSRLFAKIAT